MRSIIVINESTKAAYTKSNRILAKYLNQIGSRTYMGSLSDEGIKDLQAELVEARSRYMSVVARLAGKNHKDVILFTVGSTKQFDDETGLYAFRQQGAPLKFQFANLSPVHQYVQALTKIASLLHDLGKSNAAFQRKMYFKIKNASGLSYEYVRHDAISYLMLKLMSGLREGTPLLSLITDSAAYDEVCQVMAQVRARADIKSLRAYFEETKDTGSAGLGLPSESFCTLLTNELKAIYDNKITSPEQFSESAILLLVLTHHRLPMSKNLPENSALKWEHSHLTYVNSDALEQNGKLDTNFLMVDPAKLPIHDHDYFKALEQAVLECRKCEQALASRSWSTDEVFSLFSILFHFARPLLVLSDHAGSVQRKDKFDVNDKDTSTIIANLQGSGANTYKGDSLKTHLMSVSKKSRQLTNLAYFAMKNRDNTDFFPRLPLNKAKKLSAMLASPDPTSKFYWQDEAHAAIKAHAGQSFLVNIIAETGSGKTIASGKIAAALSPTLRYVYCLGLRSLTLQTSQSYADDLGMTDVATIIGNRLVKEMFEETTKQASADKPKPVPGEDRGEEAACANENDPYDMVAGSGMYAGDWLEYLDDKKSPYRIDDPKKGLMNANNTKLIDTPVVVATIDQLIGLVKLDTVSAAKLYPRLFCSDLILDEVDNYDLNQINIIAKLVYLTAMYGNSVICMSATLNATIATAFAEAFAAGVREHNVLMNTSRKALLANVSNRTSPEIIELSGIAPSPVMLATKKLEGKSLYSYAAIAKYNELFIHTVKSAPIKQHVEVLNTGLAVDEEVFELVQTRCDQYHNEVCEESERNVTIKGYPNISHVSVGFAKFNTVKQARKFATFAMETVPESDNKLYSVLCYHSKFSLVELHKIDKILNTLVNRKKLKAGEAFSEKAVSEILIPLLDTVPLDQVEDLTSIQILIVTTSILETGRDHDYDYCVLEPNSTRSLIQAAGRVYRHRPASGLHRVTMLSNTVKEQCSWALRTNLLYAAGKASVLALKEQSGSRLPTAANVFGIPDAAWASLTSASSLRHGGEGAHMHTWEQKCYDKALWKTKSLTEFANGSANFKEQSALGYLTSYSFLAGVQFKVPFREAAGAELFSHVKIDPESGKLEFANNAVYKINAAVVPEVILDAKDSCCSLVKLNVTSRSRALALCVYVSRSDEDIDQSVQFVVKAILDSDFKSFDNERKAEMLRYALTTYYTATAYRVEYNALIGFDAN